jgi:predicted metal-dependent peptidase
MELAMEVSANDYIREPLPENRVTWEEFRDEGLRPGQSTWERYELLVRARCAGAFIAAAGDRWVDDHHGDGVGSVRRAVEGGDSVRPETVRRLIEEAVSEARKASPAGEGDERVGGEQKNRGSERFLLAGKEPGKLLEELSGVDERPRHYMNWRAALQMFTAQTRTPVHTFARPSRRAPRLVGLVPGRIYYPGQTERPHLIVAIDTSGSMSSEELTEVSRQLLPISSLVRLTVVECDAAIQRVYPFTDTIREFAGRGGTDLRPVFEPSFLRAYRPDGVVYFTDGFGPYPEKDPGIRTLWILTKPWKFSCPWGQRAMMGRRPEPV